MNIKTLVQGFAENIRQLKASQYKESQVRLHYIDPFWALLGWDVSNADQLPPQDVEVMVEPSMDSIEDDGLRTREPDYLFRANGFPRFIVEAKKPVIDIDTDKKAIFQTKRYAWNAAIPFAVLTDFEQFRLYDTTLKPIINEPSRGLVLEFKIDFQDYPAKWDEFIATFGRDAVAKGSLEKLRARIRKISPNRRLRTVDRMLSEIRGDEPVDKVFLGYLETYRKHFARAIYHDNKKDFPEADTLHGAARLTEAVQRLIDRMVFMRVCEDRGIRQYGSLKAMLDRISAEGGDFYRALCAEFRELDREYNGYLFKYHFSESLAVSDDILADLIRTLYPPDGPWDFSAIGDDILGIVYEKFIGSVVVVKLGEADVEQKPEVRHANGVYYTPRFVVDTIIRRVVGPKIAGRSPMEVLDIKILDPACGSGSFLVATFQYLIDHCLAAIANDPSLAKVPATPRARKKRKDIAFQDKKEQWQLAPDFKAALLTNCIHGVDIDQQAVEVTVMSLYLKMLEGKLPPHWQRDWLENELLPSLDKNILCGNSLINSVDFDRCEIATHGGLFPPDDDTLFRINRFDWDSHTHGFGSFLDSEAEKQCGRKGFDCIIGNPPYIRVQELNKWASKECAFYKWRYKSAAKGNYDIYVVFVERCLELLAQDGLLGFIMPHKFWQAKYGEGLRKVIANGNYLRSILDFGDQQVFQGVTTYTAVHIFGAQTKTNTIDYAKILDLEDGRIQCAMLEDRKQSEGTQQFDARPPKGALPWVFCNSADSDWLDAVRANNPTLEEISKKIAQGIVTSTRPQLIMWIQSFQFYSRFRSGELPIHSFAGGVAASLPRGDFPTKGLYVRNATIKTLFC
jgi:type I restriction-modification system DNA methylase subunit